MGDTEFAELYGRNVGVVYKLCYVYLKNSFEAEDAVQTVFLKLLQAEIQFSSKEHERAWLITSSKNQCRDMLKSWWRRRRTSFDSVAQIAQKEGDNCSSKIVAELLELPQKYRVVLYLYYFEDYSIKEITKLIGRNESTIRTQLQRGRELLKNKLGGKIIEQ